ncbi:baculoviral IAP repeat-containing protein 7-A-like isoform X1 [Mercenaria mercenaria]|uniref:baculoviral IAP repeat-containing protein 7-A-like isoform X1 n=1 Tax=Mercenaria mercenaria TaxID=6596 RepID=UPI00234E6CD5|nr:baculoviral IAP repeat-containing protein 7-A-like isoform X1 [Mercenaria mercenaria]
MPGNIYHKHQDYENYEHRLDSFNGWAHGDKVQPEELASAGLFYTGTYDFVKCFSCGTGIRNWKHGDDPWIVHAQSLPKYIEEEEDNAPNGLMPCRVCMNKNSNSVFISCSHMVTCETCAPEIGQFVECEVPIIERIRAYTPYMA